MILFEAKDKSLRDNQNIFKILIQEFMLPTNIVW